MVEYKFKVSDIDEEEVYNKLFELGGIEIIKSLKGLIQNDSIAEHGDLSTSMNGFLIRAYQEAEDKIIELHRM